MIRLVLMKHNGNIDDVDKSKRHYEQIKVIKINSKVLFTKKYEELMADRSIYINNNKNNFINLLDENFLKKIVNRIH